MTAIMVQGTTSGAGKTTLVAALCRALSNRGYTVSPFKAQNMSRYSHKFGGLRISRAQAVQARAARCGITADINPILLDPKGDDVSDVYLNGKHHSKMSAKKYYAFAKKRGLRLALDALGRLAASHDIVVIEGAGSPAEINIGSGDIANMAIAEAVRAPVILVADIERGGAFASIAGTIALLTPRHRRLVRGLVINKFRGDEQILRPGYAQLRRITNKPVLGTIPMIPLRLPEEDSLGGGRTTMPSAKRIDSELQKIAGLVEERLDVTGILRMCRK